jgi:hypothetical protein
MSSGTAIVSSYLRVPLTRLRKGKKVESTKTDCATLSGIHAVDKVHRGSSDSSVLYIPVCPITKANARYLVRQREAFLRGYPGPDFPGGKGEAEHIGRLLVEDLEAQVHNEGLQAMGLKKLEAAETSAVGSIIQKANSILDFN